MAKFEKGKVANPAGCPKGAHHIGRPASKVKQLAKRRSLAILQRIADIAAGKNFEQVVTENGESIRVPAAVREQIKAGEVVLKVAQEIGADVEINNHNEGSRLIFVHPEGSK